ELLRHLRQGGDIHLFQLGNIEDFALLEFFDLCVLDFFLSFFLLFFRRHTLSLCRYIEAGLARGSNRCFTRVPASRLSSGYSTDAIGGSNPPDGVQGAGE